MSQICTNMRTWSPQIGDYRAMEILARKDEVNGQRGEHIGKCSSWIICFHIFVHIYVWRVRTFPIRQSHDCNIHFNYRNCTKIPFYYLELTDSHLIYCIWFKILETLWPRTVKLNEIQYIQYLLSIEGFFILTIILSKLHMEDGEILQISG